MWCCCVLFIALFGAAVRFWIEVAKLERDLLRFSFLLFERLLGACLEMGSGGDLGRLGSMRRFKRVNVRFKLPYMTHWGQNLIIVGSDALLGAWNVEKGQSMTPHHEGDILVWQVSISVPEHFKTEYNYLVVDDRFHVLRRESGAPRVLEIPDGLPNGATVEVHDLWQVCTCTFKDTA